MKDYPITNQIVELNERGRTLADAGVALGRDIEKLGAGLDQKRHDKTRLAIADARAALAAANLLLHYAAGRIGLAAGVSVHEE